MSTSTDICEEVVFTGRVQGVFFRATVIEVAQSFAVTGWVRNERDGSVRLLAEGTVAEVDAFIAAVIERKRENVDDLQRERRAATGEFDGFAIRR